MIFGSMSQASQVFLTRANNRMSLAVIRITCRVVALVMSTMTFMIQ